MNRNIVFLGGMFPKCKEKEVFSNSIGHTQAAANELQWKLISGIEKNIGRPIRLFTGLFIGSYPKHYKKLVIHSNSFSHDGISDDYQVGFINLSIVKQFFYYVSYRKAIIRFHSTFDKSTIVIGYSANMSQLLTFVKRKNPNITTLLILPDLPIYTSLDSNNILLKLYKKYSNNKFLADVKSGKIDYYVFLTNQMGEYLNIDRSRYTVIEGIAPNFSSINTSNCYKDEKIVLYTGTLARQYGIIELINEFFLLDGNYRLIICGGGDDSNYVQEKCKMSDKITFKGLVPHEEVMSLQKRADVLVNPRRNDNQFTKYSFPSKLLEYLASGKPTVCYKLDGIPKEYDDVFFYASPEQGGLARAIDNALNLSEQEYINYQSKVESLLLKKTDKSQCSKIIELLEKRN